MRRRAKILGGGAVVLVAAFVCVATLSPGRTWRRGDAADRRWYVDEMRKKTGTRSVVASGPDDEILVVDATGCDVYGIYKILDDKKTAALLTDLGFVEIRCADSVVGVRGPWE